MKLAILTATYNRADKLNKLYESLLKNKVDGIDIEWLIMDDGGTDNTSELIEEYQKEKQITIKYYKQKNQGKMSAINNLMPYVEGELLVECDSDDYFTEDAFKIIKTHAKELLDDSTVYALVFLKIYKNKECIGTPFPREAFKSTMFDIYMKKSIEGDKSLVFKTSIRKKYQYIMENDEKFSTEARLHHQMDKKYQVICYNKNIMICEYQSDGYTKNIKNIFKKYPFGHYAYFKEMFDHDFKKVRFNKRFYVIKHYILFTYLTKMKHSIKNVKGIFNKFLYIFLYIPGIIKTKKMFKE